MNGSGSDRNLFALTDNIDNDKHIYCYVRRWQLRLETSVMQSDPCHHVTTGLDFRP